MLLHHRRILEGIWALYSFARLTEAACQIFVHSDGSLTASDAEQLHQVLPGTRVVTRQQADQRVEPLLRDLGLCKSIRFRGSLIFALKLFDPFFFGDHSSFVLLDSDVLFFRRPDELLADLADPCQLELPSLYSRDNGDRYCLTSETLTQMLGRECIAFFNPGVVRTNRTVLDAQRIEHYLERPEFWGTASRPHYYAELTLWAMLLTAVGARPLPPTYAITPPLTGVLPTSGHYCGGGYPATWFYSQALPHLAHQFGI
jgi:hypothetical protein